MRTLLLFLIFLFFTNCSDRPIDSFIPEEFKYPENKIGFGKTFVYQNSTTNQRTFEDLKSLSINGKHYQTFKRYDSTEVSDSAIKLNGKVVEIYNFFMNKGGSPIKAQNLQDSVVDNGCRLGVHKSKADYQTNELIYTTSSQEEFLKDTTMAWDGTHLLCLVTVSNSKVEIKVKADTSYGRIMHVVSKSYYAKGIGVLQYSTQFTDQSGKDNYGLWKLESINDIKH